MKKFMAILILTFGLLSLPFFVLSAEVGGNSAEIEQLNKAIAEKKDKITQLEKSIEDYKQKIKQKQLESVSLSNQMAILDNRVAQVELDVLATQEKLNSLDLEIEALNLSIEDKENTINKQKNILAELLRTLQQNQSKSYIEVAVNYNNFSDFYNQVQYLRKIEGDLGKNVRGVKLAKIELDNKKIQSEERKNSYEELKEELLNKKKDLEDQNNIKQNLLVKSRSSEMVYNTLLVNLRREYQQIENEITGIEQEMRKKLTEQDKLSNLPTDNAKFTWPATSRYITSNFHDPNYPYRHVFEHSGIDIRASQGTPIKAAASGYVGIAKHCSVASCYSYIMLIHSDGLATVYAHMSKIAVKNDQFVARGDIIGYSGGTPGTVGAGPFVTGPHLHFEVRKNGIPVNPLNYL